MLALQLFCGLIVVSYVLARLRFAGDRRGFAAAFVWIAVAAWVGESTCIWWYDFYGYDPKWRLFIGPVPVLVVLIWPCVVCSAWDIARHLAPTRRWLVASVLVLADASLIEPVAVASGLWSWKEPGLFSVPPVGLLGWAIFAGATVLVLERTHGVWTRALVAPVSLVIVHAGVLVAWWGALRWVNQPLPAWLVVALWAGSAWVTLYSLKARLGARIPRWVMWVRVPPALFFFVLLVWHVRDPALWAWALAFAPPYLSLQTRGARVRA